MAEIIWDSELGPSWPDDWEHTTVHAQFVAVTGDGADSNRLPDIAPSGNGEVIFTPSLRTVRYVGADGPYVVSLKQYRAVVDSEGYLCTPDTFGQPGERGIVLPSTDAEVLEPRGEDDNAFTWRVDFDLPAVTIRSDHIAVPVGGPYNLVDLLSPERAAGVVHIIDRVSARDAKQAAQEATAARDLILPARDETLAARDEAVQAAQAYKRVARIGADHVWEQAATPPSGVTYEWDDGANQSASVEREDGTLVRRNLAPNPEFDNGVFGWVAVGASLIATTSHSLMWGRGTNKLMARSNSESTFSIRHARVPVEGGQWLAGRWLLATERTGDAREQVWFYDSDGELLDTAAGNYENYTFYDGIDQTWVYQAPPGTVEAEIRIYGSPDTEGWRLWLDRVHFAVDDTEQDALDQVSEFFYGNMTDDRQKDIWVDDVGVYHYWQKGWGWAEFI